VIARVNLTGLWRSSSVGARHLVFGVGRPPAEWATRPPYCPLHRYANSTRCDLAITKTDGTLTFVPGTNTTYTIVGEQQWTKRVTNAAVRRHHRRR